MKNRKKLRARRECKRVHHTYAVCTQRKMTKNDEKSICKPTLPTLTIFPPPPLNAICTCWPFVPNNSKGEKRGLDGQKSKPNQTLFDAIDAVTLCAVALPHDIHTYIYTYIYSPLFTIRLLWFYCFV